MERRTYRPKGVRNIYIVDWIMLVFLVLGLFGVLIPLLVVPPYPISGGRIGGGVAGVSVLGVFIVLTAVAIFAVLRGRRWGRSYHMIYSIAMLILSFPIGTILQGIALYYLATDAEVKTYFGHKPPGVPPEEKAA